MEKGEVVVGRVRMNPISNKLTPCIELIIFDGITDGEMVLLEVKGSRIVPD